MLNGEFHLVVDKNATAVKLPVGKMPLSVELKVKAEIQRLAKLGIIKPAGTPTNWISSMVMVLKGNDKIRLCIDPKPLNKALNRNHFPTPTIEDVLPELSKARIFTVADAKNGIWQIRLDEESSYLTTFGRCYHLVFLQLPRNFRERLMKFLLVLMVLKLFMMMY